ILESIFFLRIKGQMVGAATARIHKLKLNFLAYALEVPITPSFKRIGLCLSAALFGGALVGTAGRVRLDRIRRAMKQVDDPTVSVASGYSRRKALVNVGKAAVVFVAIFVFFG